MAKVKIQGNASGTGILTVTAPNTSTDRTITLPDEDVTLGAATPSIDDNGNATAITIGTDEKVTLSSTDSENLFIDGGHSTNASIKIKGAYHSNLYAKLTESAGQFIISADDGNQETNSCLRFKVKGTERMRLTPDGITFNGDTAAANALDDYEEGTWTAGITGANQSGMNTTGYYTKIGRQVFFQWYSAAMTISSASGGARVTGLPFTSSASGFALFIYQHGNAVDGGSTGGYVQDNNNWFRFVDTNAFADSTYVNGSGKYIMVSGTYFV